MNFSLPGKARGNWLLALLRYIHTLFPHRLRSALGEFLAYQWEKRQGDNLFQTFLKSFGNGFLVYFPILHFLRFIQRLCSDEPWYPIEDEILLTTTRVIFTRSKRTAQQICLKLWQRSDDKVCQDMLIIRSEDYLLEGLEFNRKFARGVYLGIAPVTLSEETKKIRRGWLIEDPKKSDLLPKKNDLEKKMEYALIMRCLNEHWRLDHQLRQSWWSNQRTVGFLAKEVACMHNRLERSPADYGTPDRIKSKLDLNRGLFLEALGQLSHTENNLRMYSWISGLMVWACENYRQLFELRHQNGSIKRCHGDLKATNLWVRPAKTLFLGMKKDPQELLALDCIDFNPEFCHIDTLSDVAMLAVDIEMHSTSWTGTYKDMEHAQSFANDFLVSYLREMKESSLDAWLLLRYYMIEKAMVCAYVSVLYDGQPDLGQRYLDIAYLHAQQLGYPLEVATKVGV